MTDTTPVRDWSDRILDMTTHTRVISAAWFLIALGVVGMVGSAVTR